MSESHQQIARRVLADLDTLVSRGELQAPQLFDIRAQLQPLAYPAPPAISPRPPSAVSQAPRKLVRAAWSYDGAEEDELQFREGDQIEVVEEVSAGWWRGRVVVPVGAGGSSHSDKVGLFPSNYVEPVQDRGAASPAVSLPPRRNLPPAFPASAPAPPSDAGDTLVDEKHSGSQYHAYQQPPPQQYSSLGPGPWQPGVARWSSGNDMQQGPPVPPPPPQHNNSYYNQPPMPYGPATPAAYGTQQPVATPEEEQKKNNKYKKFAGRMGNTMAGGFAGGVGFGIGSHLF